MDCYALARAARALDGGWREAFVQRIWTDLEGRLVLKLRRPGRTTHLLISPARKARGLGTVEKRTPCPPKPPAMAAWLRAHLEGGQLTGARAEPFERVVHLSFRAKGQNLSIILDCVGQTPRIIVLEQSGAIAAADRWDDTVRAKGLYPLPARPVGKLNPAEVTPFAICRWLEKDEPPADHLIGLPHGGRSALAGLDEEGLTAHLAALVALYRGSGCLAAEAGHLVSVPSTLCTDDEVLDVAGSWLTGASAQVRESEELTHQQREEKRWRKKLKRKFDNIRRDLEGLEPPEVLSARADSVAASLGLVRRGDDSVEVPDPADPGTTIRVTLDPKLSPGENLNLLYEKVKKTRRAIAALQDRLEQTRAELEGPPPNFEPPEATGKPAKKRDRPTGPFRRYVSSDKWAIWMGRNRVENDQLVREAKPWDIWLHARDGAGAHVLIKKPGREARVPDRTLAEAAGIAAANSQLSGDALVEVVYIEAARVKKPKGAGPGRVIYSGEKTLPIAPGAGSPKLVD